MKRILEAFTDFAAFTAFAAFAAFADFLEVWLMLRRMIPHAAFSSAIGFTIIAPRNDSAASG